LQEEHLEKQKNSQLFLECLLPIWHKDNFIPGRLSEDYSNEAHQSAVTVAIELSMTLQDTESQFNHDSSDTDYLLAQNPTKSKIVSNNFLTALPSFPTIHWSSQMFDDPNHCLCPCSANTKLWREQTNISVHPSHGCMSRKMTPNQLINHLKNKGDSTHKAIFVYLTKLASFQ
jgi:hypothetical protein